MKQHKIDVRKPKTAAQRLPNEVLFQIMSTLPSSDAYQCMFVCKSWYTSAIVRFYDNLKLNPSKLEHIYKQFPKYLHQYFIEKKGHMVKQLTISDGQSIKYDTSMVLKIILPFFSKLQTVNLSKSKLQAKQHLKALSDSQSFAALPIEKITLFQEYDPELPTAIYYPDFNSDILKDYLHACVTYRKTLKHLVLHDTDYVSPHYLDNTVPAVCFLSPFKSLTHLTFTKNQVLYSANGGINISEIDSILKQCENLETLEVINHYNGNEIWFQKEIRQDLQHLRRREQHMEEERVRQETLIDIAKDFRKLTFLIIDMIRSIDEVKEKEIKIKYPPGFPSKNLKNLTFVTPYLPEEQMEYIMNNIPLAQLKKLDLVVNRLCPYGWLRYVGCKKALIFGYCLSQVKNLRLYFKTDSINHIANNFIAINGHHPLQEVWNRVIFWRFVHTIRNARDLNYSINFDVYAESIIFQPDIKLHICEEKKTITLTEKISLNSLLYEEIPSFSKDDPSMPPPPPAYFYKVKNKTCEMSVLVPPSDCSKELENIFKHFNYLHRLKIRSTNRMLNMYTDTIDRGCIIVCESDKHPPYRLDHTPKLTKLTLQRAYLTTRFMGVITKLLPEVRELSLVDCDYFDFMNWMSKNTTLDLRRFSRLRSLALTIQTNTSSYKYAIVCLQEYDVNIGGLSTGYHARYYKSTPFTTEFKKLTYQQYEAHQILFPEPNALYITIKVSNKLDQLIFYPSDYRPQDIILQ